MGTGESVQSCYVVTFYHTYARLCTTAELISDEGGSVGVVIA